MKMYYSRKVAHAMDVNDLCNSRCSISAFFGCFFSSISSDTLTHIHFRTHVHSEVRKLGYKVSRPLPLSPHLLTNLRCHPVLWTCIIYISGSHLGVRNKNYMHIYRNLTLVVFDYHLSK